MLNAVVGILAFISMINTSQHLKARTVRETDKKWSTENCLNPFFLFRNNMIQ